MTTAGEERDYLSPGEAAHFLRISPKTISRWADAGWIPVTVTLGGHRRFRREDVEDVAERMRTHSGAARS